MVCDLYPTEKIEGAFAFETGVPRPETSKNCCMKKGIFLWGIENWSDAAWSFRDNQQIESKVEKN